MKERITITLDRNLIGQIDKRIDGINTTVSAVGCEIKCHLRWHG